MKSALTMGTVGTFNYTAPEMMRSPNYDEKVGPLAAWGGVWQSARVDSGEFWRHVVLLYTVNSLWYTVCCRIDLGKNYWTRL